MPIKRITILIIYLSVFSAYTAHAETQLIKDDNKSLNDSGFKFSPIAHANTAELLNFIATFTYASKQEQTATYMEVIQGLAKDKNDIKLKIKHAAIFAIPNSSLRDTKVAQQHLDVLLADTSLSESNMSLVKLIHIFTLDHNKQQKKLHKASKRADVLKQKNRALSQKLNDIKNIEKTMIERNAKANNK